MINEEVNKSDGVVERESPVQQPKESNVKPITKREEQQLSKLTIDYLNLFNAKQLAAAENLLTKLMRSDKGGIKSVNDGLAILLRAQELNLPFSSCCEHIHVINGKTGIDIHLIKALLLRAGCTWRCTKDYQPLYEYTDSFNVFVDGYLPSYAIRCNNSEEANAKSIADKEKGIDNFMYVYPVKWYKDVNGNIYKDYQLNTKQFGIAVTKQQIAEIAKLGKTPVYRVPNSAVDYVTEYEITRVINGKVVTSVGHFSYSEAVQADMFKKDTYKSYPRILIGHRAFTYAARDIASDLLFGLMETTELKIINNVDLNDNDLVSIEDADVVEL